PHQSEFAVNIQFVVYNPGRRTAVLRGLTGVLSRPANTKLYPAKDFQLQWHSFIKGNPAGMETTETVYAVAIDSHASKLISVQLRGSYKKEDGIRAYCFDWFPGKYDLQLKARVNRRWQSFGKHNFTLDEIKSGMLSPTNEFREPSAYSVEIFD